jgi:hypothetical protein
MFAKDTLEDPASRTERDGFLDEIERISDANGVFDSAHIDVLDAFLAEPGPAVVPEPEHLERYERAAALPDDLGVETMYAFLSFGNWRSDDPDREAVLQALDARLPRPAPDAPYLELDLANLPQIAKPRVQPKRLSTGQAPLEIARVGSGWRISCTGCGEASPPVEFRWQVLDQTVACRCD